MTGKLIVFGLISLLGLFIYFQTKTFRRIRSTKLINSSGFDILTSLGFKLAQIGSTRYYRGKFKGYNFIVFIDYDDYFFKSSFSLCFVVSFRNINDSMFMYLNDRYYNRLRSNFFSLEHVFFNRNFAQFRYSNSLLKIRESKIERKLNKIVQIMEQENLKSDEFDDIKEAISRSY